MKIVIYSLILNQHQAPVADELWKQTNHEFCFVEISNMTGIHKKGDTNDYSDCPYLLRAWESDLNWEKAMELAVNAEACLFDGIESYPFMIERLKLNKLSFDVSERWLKRGLKNMLSPVIMKMFCNYWIRGWHKKSLFKLCSSAFAMDDHQRLGMYKDKCYKWGYFTSVLEEGLKSSNGIKGSSVVRLMWCARFIHWKHPELVIQLAKSLKDGGYDFHLAMYGDGELREKMEQQVNVLGLRDNVHFTGNVPNEIIHQTMRETDIFLFTSDKEEGWGAVANEAMSEGCLLIGSDEIGAVPYLVKDGENGLIFKSRDMDSFYNKVVWATEHSDQRKQMQQNAIKTMQEVWSPKNAAKSLLQLIGDLQHVRDTSIKEGPCSKA